MLKTYFFNSFLGVVKTNIRGNTCRTLKAFFIFVENLNIMRKAFLSTLILFALIVACNNEPKNDLESQISDLENQLFEQKDGVINKKEAANMIHLYLAFVKENPQSEKAPEFLFKAADVSINAFHSEQTIRLFNQLIEDYPGYEKVPQALFLKAFTFENHLNEMDSAKANYELFLEKYPEHSFANDAQVSLLNLGKTPEEIIKSFNSEKN